MELNEIKSGLTYCKKFVDGLFAQDFISATDYQTFYEIASRLDRKIDKRKLKEHLLRTKNEKNVE